MLIKPEFQEDIIEASDNNRRHRVISIIAKTLFVASIVNALTILYYKSPNETLMQTMAYPEALQTFISSMFGFVMSTLALLLIRTPRLIIWAGMMITVGTLITIALSDNIFEVTGGRTTVFFSLPILLASITIRPKAAFFVTGISTVIMLMRPGGMMKINLYAIIAFWILAICVWLATSIMEKAIHAAQRETQRVKAMLGIVSHELRTPLSIITGYSELLVREKQLNESQTEKLKRIMSSTNLLTTLVNQLLESAQINTGRLTLKPITFDPEVTLKPVAELAEKKATEKGLQFQYQTKNLPETVVMDPLRLQQVVTNLIDNAVKFTLQGTVALTVTGEAERMIIAVSDTGPGMSKDSVKDLFQEFVQGQYYVTREYGGMGLGLPIVRNLVVMMGGEIAVDSKLGVGTTFIVKLPQKAVSN